MISKSNYNKLLAAGIAFSLAAVFLLGTNFIRTDNTDMTLIITQFLLGIATFAAILICKQNFKETLSLRPAKVGDVVLSALSVIAFLPASLVLSTLMLMIIEMAFGALVFPEALTQTQSLATMLIITVLPAFFEECLFRGVIFNGLKAACKPHKAIILCGVLFGLFHMDVQRFISQAILGGIMAYVVYRTGSIVCGMAMHFANNGVAMLMTLAQGNSSTATEILEPSSAQTISVLNTFKETAQSTGISYSILIVSAIIFYIILIGIFSAITVAILRKIKRRTEKNFAPAEYHLDSKDLMQKQSDDSDSNNATSDVYDKQDFQEQEEQRPRAAALVSFIPGLIIIAFIYVLGIMTLISVGNGML